MAVSASLQGYFCTIIFQHYIKPHPVFTVSAYLVKAFMFLDKDKHIGGEKLLNYYFFKMYWFLLSISQL